MVVILHFPAYKKHLASLIANPNILKLRCQLPIKTKLLKSLPILVIIENSITLIYHIVVPPAPLTILNTLLHFLKMTMPGYWSFFSPVEAVLFLYAIEMDIVFLSHIIMQNKPLFDTWLPGLFTIICNEYSSNTCR